MVATSSQATSILKSATTRDVRVRVPSDAFWDSMHRWQGEAFDAFDDRRARFFGLKWHRGARKTTWLVNLLIREAVRNPMRTYMYVGPTLVQARAIVWTEPTMLFNWLPDKTHIRWIENKSEMSITFPNKSVLAIRGADHPDSIRGMNPYGVGIDEFAEAKPDLWPAIIQPIMRRSTDRWCVMTYTPKPGYARELWNMTQDDPEWYHMVLRASQSGLISQTELDAARRTTAAWLYDQEYECVEVTDEDMVLITSALLESLKGVRRAGVETRRRVVAYDPNASLTGDRSVVYYIVNGEVLDEDVFWERDPLKGAARAMLMGEKHKCQYYAVDWTGIGTGVCGKLQELGKQVLEFIAAGTPAKDTLQNVRTEAYWDTMLSMMNKEIPFPDGFPSAQALREELTCVRAKTGTKIGLEAKHEVRKRLGRSPDHADTYVIGQWAMSQVPVETDGVPLESWRQHVSETDIANSYDIRTVL